jgi:hypothetical protein
MRALAKGDGLCGIALNAICLQGCSCTALGYVAISFVKVEGIPDHPLVDLAACQGATEKFSTRSFEKIGTKRRTEIA